MNIYLYIFIIYNNNNIKNNAKKNDINKLK